MSNNFEDQNASSTQSKATNDRLDIDTQTQNVGRDRSTSDAYFPPTVPPSSPLGAAAVPFALPAPFTGEGDTSFSRSIDAVLATQTEREVAEENRKTAALSKRASNVLKLTQEKQNLEQELKAMADRLEEIERRAQELKARGDNGTPPDQATPLPTPPVDS
ncbi:hypothetical protein M408DRAFT_21830 [Serendipita vermifera MAFF 305830]|uniref:Uncharacterized protein n=1 Tax=Serendipita vermifera MAFF 305830 TaxID=933852 RepID=A0A0C3B2J6_SERVB|nr:hypothetical protein M408DRAFT_21830 [Serendipita vermifera MAFF 305830]